MQDIEQMNNYRQKIDIETPSLIIYQDKMMKNIKEMQKLAINNNINLRPHVKTHKIPEIAQLQTKYGAVGIAASKISEAEVFAENGIEDIQIANLIVGRQKYKRLSFLKKKLKRLTCCVDSSKAIKEMNEFFAERNEKMEVFIKIDVGFNRCGVEKIDDIIKLCKMIESSDGLELAGVLTHAGQAYACKSIEEIQKIGYHEANHMNEIAAKIRSAGVKINEISIGSTPTAKFAANIVGSNELRVGNYVFYDMIQVMLGVIDIERCAQRVLSTVVGVYSDGRAVIDAGSKALGLDMGGHGNETLDSHGYISDDIKIVRLSEEHGVLELNNNAKLEIGQKIEIIPNHACAVENLFDRAYLVDDEKVIEEYFIAARGKSQ